MALEQLSQHPGLTVIQSAFDRTAAEIFVVGGAVRDALLGRPVTDLDLVIRGLDADRIESTLRTLGRVNLVGKKFAVFKLIINKHIIDVALPRTDDSYGTGKYKDVAVTADPQLPIEDDLKRRDFTINAMAWNAAARQLIDPFNGQSDLTAKLVRAVGDPIVRFQEDATRIVRAVRFAIELRFTIEPQTQSAIVAQRGILADRTVSHHVLRNELTKIFSADVDRGLSLCDELGLTAIILPQLGQSSVAAASAAMVRREGVLKIIQQQYGH
ncbi:MAG: CCA tRNA nucleotidyltransferase [Candidatus Kerfeldbacteria bacterium]|nr:CCA tRNA nucleotidyltransferase [Candidatus Kerfeldbacteria bacterium]